MKSSQTRSKKAARGEASKALAERERAIVAETSVRTRAEVERLMARMREANERLIVAAVRAQDVSDEADEEAGRAKREVNDLMNQLREANDRLAHAATRAHEMTKEAERGAEKYRQLSSRLLTLQDEERRRLSRDLHDSTGQRLAAILVNLGIIAEAEKSLDPRSREALAESRSLADQCCREVRTLSHLLHPPLLDIMGLLPAVRSYAEGFSKRSDIHVAVDLGEVGRLPAPVETCLFRTIQESLTNVHRHARARTASIRLTTVGDLVALEVHDQGRGLRDGLQNQNGQLVPTPLGVGIQGMQERVRLLGGTFDIEFTRKGTTVRVSLPLSKDTR